MITVRHARASLVGSLAVAAFLSACATTNQPSARDRFLAALDSLGYTAVPVEGPRVAISSETEQVHGRRIIPRLHVADDAYVAVVNVWPSGTASVIYPASPDDDGFLRGGRTYDMPSMFSGFATMFPPSGAHGMRYVRYARSTDVQVGARGPGYLVLVASRTPLDLHALDTAGLFDDVELEGDVREMEPQVVTPWIAVLASGGNTGITIDHARYGGYDGMTVPGSMLAYRTSSRYCGFGYFGALASRTLDFDYNPACNAEALRYEQLRGRVYGTPIAPLRPPVIRRDSTRPPADTLHDPTMREAEVRAAWSALVRQQAARRSARVAAADEIVPLPRSSDGEQLDDERIQRRRDLPRSGEASRRAEPAPQSANPSPRRSEHAPRRTEPAPARTEQAPRRTEQAPRSRPVEAERGGEPQRASVPPAGSH